MFVKVATVAALASFEIYAAIPAGFAFGLPPWMILGASILGGLAGVFVAAFLGDRIKAFVSRYKKKKEQKPKTGLVHRIWEKYGIIGLGFLGTMTVGARVLPCFIGGCFAIFFQYLEEKTVQVKRMVHQA